MLPEGQHTDNKEKEMLNAKLDLLMMPVDEYPKVKIEMHGTCLLGVKSAVMQDIQEMATLEHMWAFRFIHFGDIHKKAEGGNNTLIIMDVTKATLMILIPIFPP